MILLLGLAALIAAAALSYFVAARAGVALARLALVICTTPAVALIAYASVQLVAAIRTNDMRYFGADSGFVLSLILGAIWWSVIYLAFCKGRSSAPRR